MIDLRIHREYLNGFKDPKQNKSAILTGQPLYSLYWGLIAHEPFLYHCLTSWGPPWLCPLRYSWSNALRRTSPLFVDGWASSSPFPLMLREVKRCFKITLQWTPLKVLCHRHLHNSVGKLIFHLDQNVGAHLWKVESVPQSLDHWCRAGGQETRSSWSSDSAWVTEPRFPIYNTRTIMPTHADLSGLLWESKTGWTWNRTEDHTVMKAQHRKSENHH